jgi:peptidoglycan/LPS O-acetylase OafA/YrhL
VIAGPFARAKAFNHNPVWREYSYLGGMDAIALGCLTALVLAAMKLSRRWLLACAATGGMLLVFSLCLSDTAYRWGLGRDGLNMTVLAVGACLLIAAAAQSGWRSPGLFAPLKLLGQRSYEIYLTHMFAVLALFAAFVHWGKPLRGVPLLFVVAIVAAGVLGWLVAVGYAEPMNRFIRRRTGVDAKHVGAAYPEAD